MDRCSPREDGPGEVEVVGESFEVAILLGLGLPENFRLQASKRPTKTKTLRSSERQESDPRDAQQILEALSRRQGAPGLPQL